MFLLNGTTRDDLYQLRLVGSTQSAKGYSKYGARTVSIIGPCNNVDNKDPHFTFLRSNNRHPYSAAFAAKVNSTLWHAKLGHPAPLILKKVLSKLHIPYNIAALDPCDSCKLQKNAYITFSKVFLSL
ncbi:hypothetical protein ACOSP7_031269 [Xanthoceras sorbifolium]